MGEAIASLSQLGATLAGLGRAVVRAVPLRIEWWFFMRHFTPEQRARINAAVDLEVERIVFDRTMKAKGEQA